MRAKCKVCKDMTEHRLEDGKICCSICGNMLIDFW